MTKEELVELSDQELLDMAKKMKSTAILNAGLIGLIAGVIIYSIAKNSYGFFTLIPIFLIYKIVNGSKSDEALKEVLKERNLER
ncbi:FUSC family protein [Portibacter lacus]|nr:FUSC family protein [Portibacter lacus]